MTSSQLRQRARPRWVFAYGSLMWHPGFATPQTMPARLHGWHRALCIYSEHYRGTPRRPGLILGLLPGGSCRGLAHRLPSDGYEAVRRYLVDREIRSDGVYQESVRPVFLANGQVVPALVYLADRKHRQFAGRLPQATALRLVGAARGTTGSNLAYLQNTVAHLRAQGFSDAALEALARTASASAAPDRRRRSTA